MDPASYRVERARPADLPDIMDLETKGFHEGIVEEEAVFRSRLELFPEGFVVLREEGTGRARGYLCAERWPAVPAHEACHFALGHDPGGSHLASGRILYIASMTVDPGLRGGGHGFRLFEEGRALVRRDSPGIEAELLIVNEDWAAARRIYASASFRETGLLPGFFPHPGGGARGAVVMELGSPRA